VGTLVHVQVEVTVTVAVNVGAGLAVAVKLGPDVAMRSRWGVRRCRCRRHSGRPCGGPQPLQSKSYPTPLSAKNTLIKYVPGDTAAQCVRYLLCRRTGHKLAVPSYSSRSCPHSIHKRDIYHQLQVPTMGLYDEPIVVHCRPTQPLVRAKCLRTSEGHNPHCTSHSPHMHHR